MARARNIKPGFFKNDELVELPFEYRLLFIGLWTLADREGRLENRPKKIRMEIFPADDVDVSAGIGALERSGLLVTYSVEGHDFIWIPTFLEHQNPHIRESESTIPAYQGKTKARPRHNLGNAKAMASTSQDRLNPESLLLIPESPIETTPATSRERQAGSGQPEAGVVPPDGGKATPNPVPEGFRHIAASIDALRVGIPAGTDEFERAGELWGVMAANGVKGTASHPVVVELVRDGVTVPELRAAIVEARKSTDAALNPAYLAAIVERLRSGNGKSNGKGAAWATDERATEAKARELGLWPARGGESWDELRGRIRAKINSSAEESVR